jgi:hypothetical protein
MIDNGKAPAARRGFIFVAYRSISTPTVGSAPQ